MLCILSPNCLSSSVDITIIHNCLILSLDPTVSTARSISQGGDPVIISVTAVMVMAALAILAIVCCLCTRRSVRNKEKKLRVSTIR